MKRILLLLPVFILPAVTSFAQAGNAGTNPGDTSWLLTSSALVLLMTMPGLAIFYGGMVRRKNILSTFYYSFGAAILVGALWVIAEYGLCFGRDAGGMIGWSLDKWFLSSVNTGSIYPGAPSIPESVFSVFQMMFAVITVALISGALVERLNFAAWILFALMWSLLIYSPLAHWVWGGGWLSTIGNAFGWTYQGKPMGTLDFAGGLVVHISSGVSALVALLYLGKRRGFEKDSFLPNSVTLTFIGTGLLWFGWFGFNAGSALVSNGLAGNAFLVTNTAAVFSAITWIAIEWIKVGKPSIIGGASGLVAGLATITPASGYVDIRGAIIIGILAAMISYLFVTKIKKLLKYDDSLDVFNIHGIGGTVGILCTGLFANPSINGSAGLFYGNPGQFAIQLLSALVGYVYAGGGTLLILLFIDKVLKVRVRVTPEQEISGLDLSMHGEQDSVGEQ